MAQANHSAYDRSSGVGPALAFASWPFFCSTIPHDHPFEGVLVGVPVGLTAGAPVGVAAAGWEAETDESVWLRFEVSDQTVLLEAFHLAGSGTDFTAHGRAHLSGAKDMDLQLDGSINMALLQSFNPKLLSRGTLGITLTAGGTVLQPVLQGRLEVKNTFISHNDFPSGLSDLNGTLSFDRNRIQILYL